MSEPRERAAGESNVRRLSDAIREAKNAMADRDDVVVEMREATRMRLELLAAELEDVIAEAPAESPAFDFAISSGQQPRFWIDAVAHVALGRDRRTYRFVRDTRNGRLLLAESTDTRPIADAVTRYVAERIVERQRDLDGGPVSARADEPKPEEAQAEAGADKSAAEAATTGATEQQSEPDGGQAAALKLAEPKAVEAPDAAAKRASSQPATQRQLSSRPATPPRARGAELFATLALVAFGALVGGAATILVLRERMPEIHNLF